MNRSYRATGINLKAVPLGEADRLLTILTPEVGLVKAIAPGARKHKSSLGGRSGLFVVNQLLLVQGKQLDKVTQAETVRSFPGLSRELGKLTAGQYLAELVLFQALAGHPEADLYHLLIEHLKRVEAAPPSGVLPCLIQGLYHLLALGGVAPDVRSCCVTRTAIVPDLSDASWRVGFSPAAGGVFQLSALEQLAAGVPRSHLPAPGAGATARANSGTHGVTVLQLNAMELVLLQQLSRPQLLATKAVVDLPSPPAVNHQSNRLWVSLERLLREYIQYYFDRPVRSATLIETCFPMM